MGPPTIGYGPGVASDAPEAYDRAVHAALSVAAADCQFSLDATMTYSPIRLANRRTVTALEFPPASGPYITCR